jgi:Holliday junction resolvase RusA-like endonuclease
MKFNLPMMMFGSYRGYETDKASGTKRKKIFTHVEENGDPGFFPSVNHIYMNTAKGGKKLTKPAEELKAKWTSIVQKACEESKWEMRVKEKVIVNCRFYFPDRRIRDTNNIFKLLMDSMEGVVFKNDYFALPRVEDFQILKDKFVKPYIEVEIKEKENLA